MAYSYVVTFQDFKDAQRLHIQQNRGARLRFIFWLYLMPIVGGLSLILLVRDITVHHFSYPAWRGGLLAALAWLGLSQTLLRPFLLRRAFKRMFLDQENQDRPVELELNDGRLISRVPGRSEGRFERLAIIKHAENSRLRLFYLRKNLFLIVPKRALPGGQSPELDAWLRQGKIC